MAPNKGSASIFDIAHVLGLFFPSVQFALAPSEFSSRDVQVDELQEGASRGVKIVYSFPWGQETLENLWSLGDSELLQTHGGVRAKIQVSLPSNFLQPTLMDM